jgi:hypothetical protein
VRSVLAVLLTGLTAWCALAGYALATADPQAPPIHLPAARPATPGAP